MKIGVLVPDPPGRDARVLRQARGLASAGHDVTVLAPTASGNANVPDSADRRGVSFRNCGPARRKWPLKPFAAVRAWLALLTALMRLRPDVVHVYGDRALARGWLIARLRGALLVYDVPQLARRPHLERLRERVFLRRAGAVIAGSNQAARAARERNRLQELPVVVRDAPDLPVHGTASACLRDRLGLARTPIILQDARGQAGGFEQLVRAVADLPGVHLVAMSDPDAADSLRLVAERERVAGRVHVIRAVATSRLTAFAVEANAVASLPEAGWAADAAAGRLLRLLAADRPGVTIPEIAEDVAAAGLVGVDAGDATALATVLRQILGSATSSSHAGPRWSAESRKLIARYDRLLSSPNGAPDAAPASALRDRVAVVRSEFGPMVRSGGVHPNAARLYAQGRRLRAEGRITEAERAFAQAVQLHPADPRYWYHWGAALRDANRAPEAIEAYREVIELGRPRSLVISAASALVRLGARREAEVVLSELEATATKSPHTWAWIAELRTSLGHVAPALAAAAAIDGDPRDRTLQRPRLRALEQCGELTAALEVARALSEESSEWRLEGALRAFDPNWLPSSPPVPHERAPATFGTTVLHLLETALPHATSGYTYRTSTVLAAQRRAGLRPVAVTRLGFPATRGIFEHPPLELVGEVPHHFLTLPGVTRYTSIPMDERVQRNVDLLAGVIERVRPDVLHATTPHYNGLLGLALREATGIPLVYEARGFPEMTWAVRPGGDGVETYGLRRTAETRCMREADVVITLSEVMREHIVGRGVSPDRVFVVPHMVDTDRFSPQPKDPDLLERYGLADRLVIGYVSSLVDYEGVDTLLRGIAEARRERPEIAGLIVGDGLAMSGLRELANELGLRDAVRFTGRVPHAETIAHYALMDVFVVPRRGLEVCACVTPLKPFEAMAMERCVVVSDLPALTETVGHGTHGRSVAPDDPESLARVLVDLAADPDVRRELGVLARDFVKRHHSRELPPTVTSGPILSAQRLVSSQ